MKPGEDRASVDYFLAFAEGIKGAIYRNRIEGNGGEAG